MTFLNTISDNKTEGKKQQPNNTKNIRIIVYTVCNWTNPLRGHDKLYII